MSWGAHIIIPGRLIYIDYFGQTSGKDISAALKVALAEAEKSAEHGKTFYCVSGTGGSSSANIGELNDVFRTFKSFPKHTKTLLITKNRATGFIAQLVFSLRGLGFSQVNTLQDAIKIIAQEDADLAAKISVADFHISESEKVYSEDEKKSER